ETRLLDLLVPLRLLGLELGELVPGRLPFLAGSDSVFGHLFSLRADSSRSHRPDRTLTGSRKRPARTPKLIAAASLPRCPSPTRRSLTASSTVSTGCRSTSSRARATSWRSAPSRRDSARSRLGSPSSPSRRC